MIGRLRGVLVEKQPPQLLLEVAGVGYEVEAPMSTFYVLPELGAEVTLYTHLVVREDCHTLFGFADHAERRLFRSLIKVNGVGARMALTILSGISPGGFVACVQHQDTAALVKLPGVVRNGRAFDHRNAGSDRRMVKSRRAAAGRSGAARDAGTVADRRCGERTDCLGLQTAGGQPHGQRSERRQDLG